MCLLDDFRKSTCTWLHAVDGGLEIVAGSVQALDEGDTGSQGQADRARQKAFGRLDTYLDENGGLKDPTKAGMPFSLQLELQ